MVSEGLSGSGNVHVRTVSAGFLVDASWLVTRGIDHDLNGCSTLYRLELVNKTKNHAKFGLRIS